MKPKFDPKSHCFAKIDLIVWKPTIQQIRGGPLHISGKVVRRRKKTCQALPGEAVPLVSENGNFVYCSNGKCWTCILSDQERVLAKAVSKAKCELDWEAAFSVLWPKKAPLEKPLRDVVSHVNRRLRESKIPVLFSLSACVVRIIQNPTT